MRRNLLPLPLATLTLVGLLAGCGGGAGSPGPSGASASAGSATGTTPPGAGGIGAAPTSAPTTPKAAPTAGSPGKKTAALTCTRLASAELGSTTLRYQDYPDPLPLAEGRWAGEDGVTVELQDACGIGDLDADGAADAVRALLMETGGTGRFFGLAVWRNVGGAPVYLTVTDLGDRTPVESITIASGRATVVYLTRTPDAPMAMLDIRRTAVFRLSGGGLTEVGHTDAPYSG
jgi:hypothetical protein